MSLHRHTQILEVIFDRGMKRNPNNKQSLKISIFMVALCLDLSTFTTSCPFQYFDVAMYRMDGSSCKRLRIRLVDESAFKKESAEWKFVQKRKIFNEKMTFILKYLEIRT